MSQRDVLAELRTARVEAPAALRARVHLVAAQAPQPPRRRRFALLVVPVGVAAVAAAVVLSTRPAHHREQQQVLRAALANHGKAAFQAAPAPAPSTRRIERYGASLTLQVADVAATVTKALHAVAGLGGFAQSVHVSTAKSSGTAALALRVPRAHVQTAIARLSRLGTVTAEQIDIQDLETGINTTDRTIARLQAQLKQLRAQSQTDATRRSIALVTARIVALQRQRATTVRSAHFATVQLWLTTPAAKPAAPHHYLRDALPWLGGAAAALVLLLALRGLGRVREERLLSRP